MCVDIGTLFDLSKWGAVMMFQNFVIPTSMALALVSFTGCATKKYVNQTVSPIDQRLGENEKRTTEQGTEIEALEADASRTREQVGDLDSNLKQTKEQLAQTNTVATTAQQNAAQAQESAKQARTYAETRTNALGKTIESLNQYELAKEGNVLFTFNKSILTDEGKQMLTELAQAATQNKRFVIEVQGFTDSSGSPEGNLALSQKRADAVVRYLTMEHKIPLRNIHRLGAGEDAPVADNKTRDGRKQNRRVEVRVFTSGAEQGSLSSAELQSGQPQ